MKGIPVDSPGIVVLLVIQLLCTASAYATDYHVHVNVGDNRNSGLLPDDAFATLSYAMRQLSPGDTLYLRAGLYSETVNLDTSNYTDGTPANPITITSYPNETPVIGSNTTAFAIGGRKGWIFEDLVFQNSKTMVIGRRDTSILPESSQCVSLAENITVRRVNFQHSDFDGIRINCGTSILIENNIFDNLRSRRSGVDIFGIMMTYQADTITIAGNRFTDIGANGIQLLDSAGSRYTDIEISHNEFEIVRPYRYRDTTGAVVQDPGFGNVGETAIGIKHGPGPILVENNTIHGFRPTLPGQDATGAIGTSLAVLNQASGVTIRKNHFYDNVIHLNIAKGTNTQQRPDRDLLISSNVFEEPADPGIYGSQIPSGVRLNSASNVALFHNTFNNQPGFSGWVVQIVNTDSVELKNNVFNNGIFSMDTDSVTNLSADYNAWSGISGNTWSGEIYPEILCVNDVADNNLGIDPLTWSPLASSPLINAGAYVGITEDFYGTDVPGAEPDMGAVEYLPGSTGIPSSMIRSADGQEICAIVLASGQYVFSCNPTGLFSLSNLSQETDGSIKLQVYADGFHPYIVNLYESGQQDITMSAAGSCPDYNQLADPGVYPGSAGQWIDISGQVLVGQDPQTPICAMVLANGQYMFSCDGAGTYALNVPLDGNGQVKLQVYADGFAPTILNFDEFSASNNVKLARASECQ